MRILERQWRQLRAIAECRGTLPGQLWAVEGQLWTPTKGRVLVATKLSRSYPNCPNFPRLLD
jgi:hypothetical protein